MGLGAENHDDDQLRLGRVESLLEALENGEDERARDLALDAIRGVVELYGEALSRVIAAVGEEAVTRLAEDELIGHLLLLHDLHPRNPEQRVRQALEEMRPYLVAHGGNAELVGVSRGVARLRLEGSCRGSTGSSASLRQAIEEVVRRAAPELDNVVAEETGQSVSAPAPALVQLTLAGRSASPAV